MWDIYIYFGLLVLSVFIWAVKFNYLQTGLRILGFTLLVTLLVEGYAAFLMFQRIKNFHIYHLLIPLQYSFFSFLFYKVLRGKPDRRAVLISIPLYLLLVGIVLVSFQGTSEVNTYARLLKNLLLIFWTLMFYREVFKGLRVSRLEKEPMFWVSTGLFFYSLGNFFFDGLLNLILGESYELAHTLFYISVFLGLLLNLTFLISFILSKRELKNIGEICSDS